ncbi:MAG: glycosyltransferase family 39 protein [Candidatus Omnitrophica bacterium]|nr:glycosyltransferase family 39 protein [Candidatus Omnitrophota bacterium]
MEKKRVPLIFWVVLLSLAVRLVLLFTSPPRQPLEAKDDDGLYWKTGFQIQAYLKQGGPLLKDLLTSRADPSGSLLEKYGLVLPWGAFKRGLTYPLFLAFVTGFTGTNAFPVFMVQALLLSLALFLVYGLGKDMGGARTGLLAAFLAAVYPPLVFVAGKIHQESLATFLLLLFFAAMTRFRQRRFFGASVASGVVLFLLSLSKLSLIYFPFFLFGILGCLGRFQRGLKFSGVYLRNTFVVFLIPYLLWMAAVSWQVQRPGTVAAMSDQGKALLFSNVPEYDGWLPDFMAVFARFSEAGNVALEKLGLEALETGGIRAWPLDTELKKAAVAQILKSPAQFLKLYLLKVRRLWWEPYDWPWRYYAFPSEWFLWGHRAFILLGLFGLLLAGTGLPAKAVLYFSVPFYATLLHCFFHIETRYNVTFMPFVLIFSGYAVDFFWKNRGVFFASKRKILMGAAVALPAVIGFHLARPETVLLISPGLTGRSLLIIKLAVETVSVLAFLIALGVWLAPALPRRRLVGMLLTGGIIFLALFGVYGLCQESWHEWKARIDHPAFRIRQEIFIPPGSLGRTVEETLRVDLILSEGKLDWAVMVNGKEIGNLGALQKDEVPSSFLIEGEDFYRRFLNDEERKAFEMRQWFSIPLPSGILREGEFNTIEFYSKDTRAVHLKDNAWEVAGDYAVSNARPLFHGPLFQRSSGEISMYKYVHDGDARLNGEIPLNHGGSRSIFFDGSRWLTDDLSPLLGVQSGEYRIRIETKNEKGESSVY